MNTSSWVKAAECLRVLAHPDRLRLVHLLRTGEQSVGALAQHLGALPHVTSQHLRLMFRCGFLSRTRRGKEIWYGVTEPHVLELLQCIESRFGGPNERSTD